MKLFSRVACGQSHGWWHLRHISFISLDFPRLGGEDREGSVSSQHLYEVRPRKDHHSVDVISDALLFDRLWHCEANAVSNAKAKRKAGALTQPPPAMGALEELK